MRGNYESLSRNTRKKEEKNQFVAAGSIVTIIGAQGRNYSWKGRHMNYIVLLHLDRWLGSLSQGTKI